MEQTTPAATAVFLSFVYPGLGHAYLGRRRQALVFAVPAIVVTAAIGLELLTARVESTLAYLVSPSGSMTAMLLFVVTGGWRVVAMVDAVIIARRRDGLQVPAAVFAALLLASVVGGHATGALLAFNVYDAGSRIFVAGGPDDQERDGSSTTGGRADAGSSIEPGDDYQATPLATPESEQDRINILLTGVDSAETRSTSLTDTLLVLSVNPADESVAMLSLPRDIANFPLYDGRTFTGKINSLMTWARNHPEEFPDGPFPTLMKEVGHLIGVPIHYYAALDLQGFRRMIDAVGGVTVTNRQAIDDPRYDWLDGKRGFFLPEGTVKLDGRAALAFARSRQGVGDSDFTRAARQQQLLVALRSKLTSPEMLTKFPEIAQAAGDTVRTSLPTKRLDEFLSLARTIDNESIARYVLGPPYSFHPPNSETGGYYTLELKMDKVAALSKELFGEDSSYWRE